ncbi:MAG: hypothetical protein IPK58_14240 [Acidobacteria bacterium]|nr:hypothetical protein [Acidobacteriota bacterium]
MSHEVPALPGVFYVVRLAKGRIDLVYIGKSRAVSRNGKVRLITLRDEINDKQDGIPRQKFFDRKMTEENIDGLDIYWFVTIDGRNHHLPGYVEGLLMQEHFERYGQLPVWNKEF